MRLQTTPFVQQQQSKKIELNDISPIAPQVVPESAMLPTGAAQQTEGPSAASEFAQARATGAPHPGASPLAVRLNPLQLKPRTTLRHAEIAAIKRDFATRPNNPDGALVATDTPDTSKLVRFEADAIMQLYGVFVAGANVHNDFISYPKFSFFANPEDATKYWVKVDGHAMGSPTPPQVWVGPFDVERDLTGPRVRELEYKGKSIKIDDNVMSGPVAFQIDSFPPVYPTVHRDADGRARFHDNGLPYQSFESLEEMAKAYVDAFGPLVHPVPVDELNG